MTEARKFQVNVRLTESKRQLLREVADAQGRSNSELLRSLLLPMLITAELYKNKTFKSETLEAVSF